MSCCRRRIAADFRATGLQARNSASINLTACSNFRRGRIWQATSPSRIWRKVLGLSRVPFFQGIQGNDLAIAAISFCWIGGFSGSKLLLRSSQPVSVADIAMECGFRGVPAVPGGVSAHRRHRTNRVSSRKRVATWIDAFSIDPPQTRRAPSDQCNRAFAIGRRKETGSIEAKARGVNRAGFAGLQTLRRGSHHHATDLKKVHRQRGWRLSLRRANLWPA